MFFDNTDFDVDKKNFQDHKYCLMKSFELHNKF